MLVIVGQLFDKGGIVILSLVIRFIFVYTREKFLFKMWEYWSVEKCQDCRLIWKLCIVCEAVLEKAIAETLTDVVLWFMITLIWKWNNGSKVLLSDYRIWYTLSFMIMQFSGICSLYILPNLASSVACWYLTCLKSRVWLLVTLNMSNTNMQLNLLSISDS